MSVKLSIYAFVYKKTDAEHRLQFMEQRLTTGKVIDVNTALNTADSFTPLLAIRHKRHAQFRSTLHGSCYSATTFCSLSNQTVPHRPYRKNGRQFAQSPFSHKKRSPCDYVPIHRAI